MLTSDLEDTPQLTSCKFVSGPYDWGIKDMPATFLTFLQLATKIVCPSLISPIADNNWCENSDEKKKKITPEPESHGQQYDGIF